MFRKIKANWRKGEAAVVVEKLLEIQERAGLFDDGPAKYANRIVQSCFARGGDLLDGSRTALPHKLSAAAIPLADAIKYAAEGDENQYALMLSLHTLMEAAARRAMDFKFSKLDDRLFNISGRILETKMEAMETNELSKELSDLLG